MRDLWSEDDATTIATKRTKNVDGWEVPKEAEKRQNWTPRARPTIKSDKNKREAVALPHAGQSYHPANDAHQHALKVATTTLQRKVAADKKFREQTMLERRSGNNKQQIRGDMYSDKNWGDVVPVERVAQDGSLLAGEKPSARAPTTKSAQLREKRRLRDKKLKSGKKLSKSELAQRQRKSRALKRQPNREKVNAEIDEHLEEIEAEVGAKLYRSHKLAQYRKKLKRDDKTTVSFGRHHHQPLALDVAPTTALTGNLRQLLGTKAGSAVVHPVVDRIKSMEARNIIPARMRHQYNKRKEVLAPGDVKVTREPFGTLPES